MNSVLPKSPSSWRSHPLSRIFLAAAFCIVPLALTFIAAESVFTKDQRVAWPLLLAALLCALGYRFYVLRFEHRRADELAGPGIGRELAFGLAMGAALSLLCLAPLAALGVYKIDGFNEFWPAFLRSAPEMVMVAVFEEILCRAIIFRIVEKAWGSRNALIVSLIFFAAAHLPSEQISGLGVLITAIAGLVLSLAYMHTRRLWLVIGLHFAWNFLFDGVFSIPVSGHAARGWIRGVMEGPSWLSGGAYGVEASAVTLLVWAAATLLLLKTARQRGLFMRGERR